MEAFWDQHVPGLFGQLHKSIVNDEKKEALQKAPENSKDKSCVNVTHSQFLLQSGISHIYIFVPMENSNAVVIFSCFNLFLH